MKHSLFTWLMTGYATVASRRRFYSWNKLLFNLSIRGLGMLQYPPEHGISKAESHFLGRLVPQWDEYPIVLDVGAHEGEFSTSLKALCPRARVFAFEPHPRSFARLQEQTKETKITTIQAACGRQSGVVTLYDYADKPGSYHASLYPNVIQELHQAKAAGVDVPCLVLDDFMAERGIGHVHLLKIDTEGHELSVLQGFSKTLACHAVDAIQFEFNAMQVVSRTWMRDFYELLKGYELYRQVQDGLLPLGLYSPIICELFAYQNIVALRRDGPIHV